MSCCGFKAALGQGVPSSAPASPPGHRCSQCLDPGHSSPSCLTCSLYFPVQISEREAGLVNFHSPFTAAPTGQLPTWPISCGRGGMALLPGTCCFPKGQGVGIAPRAEVLAAPGGDCSTALFAPSHTAAQCQRQVAAASPHFCTGLLKVGVEVQEGTAVLWPRLKYGQNGGNKKVLFFYHSSSRYVFNRPINSYQAPKQIKNLSLKDDARKKANKSLPECLKSGVNCILKSQGNGVRSSYNGRRALK